MKILHWCMDNVSGMSNVARAMVAAERAIGIDAFFADCNDANLQEVSKTADIHVIHTHCPDFALKSGKPLIWMAHGTPEVMFHSGYEQGLVSGAYGHGDAWMLAQYWLQHCDVSVTFWPRHQAIWKSLSDKRTRIECIPLGIDKTFWRPQQTQGKFAGSPSVFTAENQYEIKWNLDLFMAWPWVTREIHGARLHAIYVPKDQHRWWFPLVNRNGTSFHAYISAMVFGPEQLRNAFASVDYHLSFVRYGDFNRLCLESCASGSKIISYTGNPYADYWIPEGDQRDIATRLIQILKGGETPRNKETPPDISETASAMKTIYESL